MAVQTRIQSPAQSPAQSRPTAPEPVDVDPRPGRLAARLARGDAAIRADLAAARDAGIEPDPTTARDLLAALAIDLGAIVLAAAPAIVAGTIIRALVA